MTSIELRHFRCLLAIAAEGTITRAASRLHLTQPAVSRTLHQLENHLGVRLVERSTHHLGLTAAGEAFRDKADAVVAAADDALDPTRLTPWPLRLGHAWAAAGSHTAELLRRWEETYPSTPLELLRVDERTAGLATGRVDAALLRGAAGTDDLVTERLLVEDRFAAVPAESELATRPALLLADLTDRTIAVNTVAGSTTLELWPPEIRPARTLVVANTDDWLAAIAGRRAVGVTAAATTSVHRYPGVTYVPLQDAPTIPLVLAWPRAGPHPAIADLLALAREVVAADDRP